MELLERTESKARTEMRARTRLGQKGRVVIPAPSPELFRDYI